MKHSISQLGGTDEYKAKVNALSPEDWRLINIPSFRKNEEAEVLQHKVRKEIIAEAGGVKRTIALGKIGNGKKSHRLSVGYVELTDFRGKGIFYVSAYDSCGSSKWNCWHPSTLTVLGEYDEKRVTCLKCLKK